YFPENLLVAHSHSAYCAIKMKIDKLRSKQQSMARSKKLSLMKSAIRTKAKKAEDKFSQS
ncbi:4484_t:CDS:2, partial [Paraglomus occultum]